MYTKNRVFAGSGTEIDTEPLRKQNWASSFKKVVLPAKEGTRTENPRLEFSERPEYPDGDTVHNSLIQTLGDVMQH